LLFHKLDISLCFPHDSKECLPGKPVRSRFICIATVEPAVFGVSTHRSTFCVTCVLQRTDTSLHKDQDWSVDGLWSKVTDTDAFISSLSRLLKKCASELQKVRHEIQ
jgi:hypothetical protein